MCHSFCNTETLFDQNTTFLNSRSEFSQKPPGSFTFISTFFISESVLQILRHLFPMSAIHTF